MRIDTIGKLITMLTLQEANLPTYQTQVGATVGDISAITKELGNLVYLVDYVDLIDANKQTVVQIKQAVFNGDETELIPPFPVFPAAAPPNSLDPDYLGRAQKRNKRFKAADGYTREIGIALGIEEDTQAINPDLVKPTIQAFGAQGGYIYSVVVGNRADSSMWEVWELRKGGAGWRKADSFTGKSGDITAIPQTPGNAEQMQIRIQLRKNNQNYGQQSDIVYVTINP